MTDLLAEIDEQMRIEKMQKFWHDHKHWVIGAIVAIIVYAAGHAYYQSRTLKQNQQSTLAMYAMQESEQFPNNITVDTDLSAIKDSEQTLLLLNAAKAYHDADNIPNAIALYEKIISDIDAPVPFDAITRILYARTATQDKETALDALSDVDSDHTYYPLALLEMAIIHADNGDYEQAIESLDIVTTLPSLPNTIYLKAQSLHHVYDLKMIAQDSDDEPS